MSAITVFKCNLTPNSRVRKWIFLESHNRIKIRKKENSNNIICFHPERVPEKAISKSTVRTVIALANRKQGQSYTFESSTNFYLYLVLVFTFVFKLFKQASHYLKGNSDISLNLQAVFL